jgi:glucosamine-6-phosphate deaminase
LRNIYSCVDVTVIKIINREILEGEINMDFYESITKEQLGENSAIQLEIVANAEEIFFEMATEMFDEIKKNNEAGKNTVLICPVGPVGQYKKFTKMVNHYKLSLKNVYIFNMDEYLDEDNNMLSPENPLSFKGIMDREFYSKVENSLNVPEENRYFPEPGNGEFLWQRMQELGGVDVVFGGIGINGHIAFNEPPEPGDPIRDEEFKNLPTRVLEISRETRVINSVGANRGYYEGMPKACITLGMRELLSARKLRFYLIRDWQSGVIRQVLHGPVTAKVPASFLQEHKDAKITITSTVAEQPIVV